MSSVGAARRSTWSIGVFYPVLINAAAGVREIMCVGLLVIALLGFLFTFALNELEHWIIPWKADR